ncbi:hypothetical protein [Methanocaldococcus infernus]|uniref:Uncharacterized protein n=1 Tax=Methanocaldococcus infernus (strain DSM 11812 / JCM 15783 / ME) TaxID=573063 RepID=D5VU26_METIM|nr:hypothetical protein [Methanocaldococcus infernus]ADG14079.1 conserved hypothetical protein [Methanocaldococcus infernus ME]
MKKLAVDAVIYVREGFNFDEAFNKVLEILGEDVKIISLERPELALFYDDQYFYRCGFMLDKELKEEVDVEKIREKLKDIFKDEIIYTLTCEILGD